ncbi:hypothetical protein KCU83_g9556, partial [Aureobasidium melanogenum]
MSSGCSDIFNCASCRQAVQTMEDTLSRHENYDNGGTGNIPEFVGFQERPGANDRQDDQDEGKYCLVDECGGIKTCALCQYEKDMEKAKRAERAKRIREEKQRERLERERAHAHHERPSWFGTPEDPLPDLWMGRPILSEEEIDVLKVLDSLPRFYLSQSEEDTILFAQSEEDKRYCTIIRRLEAELMSRDFWMQSLGFDADDGFGNFPAGDYRLVDAQSTPSAREQEPTCVERWASDSDVSVS